MGKTSIEWTDASWNPIVGCTEVSPGCANCYAARLASSRLRETPHYIGLAEIEKHIERDDYGKTRWTGKINFLPERLEEPLHWRKPRKIFVCDMGDLFHEGCAVSWVEQVFSVMAACPQHAFQVLTKRSSTMRTLLSSETFRKHVFGALEPTWPLPNVWVGVSVENQHFADERIPVLLQTPAAVRWISCEPLLGQVQLLRWMQHPSEQLPGVDWVVCGGESGPNARPMDPNWARCLRGQCELTDVPFFFKQWGEWAPLGTVESPRTFIGNNLGDSQMMLRYGKKLAGRLLDGREWNEFPRVAP